MRLAACLGRDRSLAGGLSLTYVCLCLTCDHFVDNVSRYWSANQANSSFHPSWVGK